MSVAVGLDALWEQTAAFGDRAFLITVAADGRAHAVSTTVRVEDGRVAVAAGSTSRANIAANPAVMLLWPPVDHGPYSLLVDGDASLPPDRDVAVTPTTAVLHRVAGADAELPSCVRLVTRP